VVAEKTPLHINGPEQIALLLKGIAFKDGEPVKTINPVSKNSPPDIDVHRPLIDQT